MIKSPLVNLKTKSSKYSNKPKFESLFNLFIEKTSIKDEQRKAKTIISKHVRNNGIKRKIKRRSDLKMLNAKKVIKRRPNIKKMSYGNRFLLKKKKKLYKKTIVATHIEEPLTTTEEYELFAKKKKSILREQRRHFFREKFSNAIQKSKPLSKRAAKAAQIFITYKRKNVFVTITYVVGESYTLETMVAAKMSCGSIGYRNKKKTTDFAAEQTIKAGGNFLNTNKVTSIDIIFSSNIPYYIRKVISKIIPSPLYVRSISLNKNRPHSYVRRRKAQRK